MNINIKYSDNLLKGCRTLGKNGIRHKKKCLDQTVLKFWNKSKRVIESNFLYSVDERLTVTEYITGLFPHGLPAL